MKKSWLILSLIFLMLLPVARVYAQEQGIRVLADGGELKFDIPPVMENGRVLVPMRVIFEALGAEINWDNDSRTVAAFKGDTGIAVQVGNPTANVNNTAVKLDVPPKIIGGRTMVPLRFVSEALGCMVDWDEKTQTATITSKQVLDPSQKTSDTAGLVGLWSSNKTSGTMVNPFTGTITGSYYSGAWYLFKEDGTFRYLIVGAGSIINGSVMQSGNYSCDSGIIKLYDIKEAWTPTPTATNQQPAYKNKSVPEQKLKYSFREAGDTLDVKGENGLSESFYRSKQ